MNAEIAARLAMADTFPKLLRLNARDHGDDIALREKDLGIWDAWTWARYCDRVRDFALGLKALGVGEGDVVALMGDNRPDWVAGEIAAHTVKAMTLGIYRDALEEEVAYLVTYGEAKVIFAEDEEQADKLLNLGDRLPSVRHIVYSDPRGMRKYDDPRLIPAAALIEKGRALAAAEPELFDRLVDATRAGDVAILCTTSGTTAHPKLAMLSAGAVLKHCAAYLETDPKGPDDEYVSVLPLPWIMEQIYALGKALISRMKVNFVEEPDTMMHDFREIAPTFVLFAPRLWESIAADVRSRIMDASPLKRALYNFGLARGLNALDKWPPLMAGRNPAVPALARPARLYAAALGGDGRRGARAGHVPLLPGHRPAAAPALRPDGTARRLHDPQSGRCRFRHGRRRLYGRGNPH